MVRDYTDHRTLVPVETWVATAFPPTCQSSAYPPAAAVKRWHFCLVVDASARPLGWFVLMCVGSWRKN